MNKHYKAGIAAASVGFVATSVALGANRMVDAAFCPYDELFASPVARFFKFSDADQLSNRSEEADTRLRFNKAWLDESVASWLEDCPVERAIRVTDGGKTRLVGYVYHASRPTRNWVILGHGYRLSHKAMEPYALMYALRGFNVLIADMRGHGESESAFIGMGWLDGDDMIEWVDYLAARFGEDISVVLHGCSMGASAVLNASGRGVASQVTAVIADSAFTSVAEEFAWQVRKRTLLPGKATVGLINALFKKRGGFDIFQASTVEAVRASRVATLIIHGGEDRFVPTAMASQLYDACGAAQKELHVVAGAGHIASFATDPEQYAECVFDFLGRSGVIRKA